MPSFLMVPAGAEAGTPRVLRVQLPEGHQSRYWPSTRPSRHDFNEERCYMRAYVEDHARRFQRDLQRARVVFIVRMAAL